MDQARKLAGDLLTKITKENLHSGTVLDEALSGDKLSIQDKAFVTELVYGSLARLYSIDRMIMNYSKVKLKKMEDQVLSQLRLAIYQIKYLDRVPSFAAVSEAVTIVRKKSPRGGGFVNGVLRSILRDEKPLKFKDEVEELAFEFSLKPDLVRHFMAEFPQRYKEVMAALVQAEGICIRINVDQISPKAYMELLDEADYEYRPGWFSDQFLYLDRQGGMRSLPGYREGYFSVQNEAAALPPMVLAKTMESGLALDLCAAPGGKSAFLKEILPDLSVIAFDLTEQKLLRMRENFKRLGLDIKTKVADATKFLPELEDQAEGILMDVPCSGLGLLGRKPDIRLHIDQKAMQELSEIQLKILNNGSRYLKSGAHLIYSTCTLNRGENQDVVQKFLKEQPDFSLDDTLLMDLVEQAHGKGLDQLVLEEGMLTVLPGQGLDGFFLAVIKKS
ncbi:MAG: 16S rRNA (cytosine(967)-C(5))-methyltransferase RsmB [Clostridium sp.]|nr:16S rRNA (cytosine(967)-C(5))-methyltransferase RsmB [Clostridium sp.]